MTEKYKRVPMEIIDRFPEINPSNYDHDNVCALNAWGVELVLAATPDPRDEVIRMAKDVMMNSEPHTRYYTEMRKQALAAIDALTKNGG